jgi:hypothetical protein
MELPNLLVPNHRLSSFFPVSAPGITKASGVHHEKMLLYSRTRQPTMNWGVVWGTATDSWKGISRSAHRTDITSFGLFFSPQRLGHLAGERINQNFKNRTTSVSEMDSSQSGVRLPVPNTVVERPKNLFLARLIQLPKATIFPTSAGINC